ncbi:Ras-related protein Rab-1A isoform X2 [Oopsacas minuta]|uniref:Ras-related protein Rab-1A isoform X2 n=1 Tax=Oopsacas minuta TaxID=111878 RepID=A0AAV7JXJ9_9METZ|nr:Ras-related protein Rab-1A isoform X2 [Oopsacas minuta]
MTSQKIVDYSTAKEFADEMKINFIETSAKCAINVEQAFLTIVCDIKRNLFENEENSNTGDITHEKRILLNPGSSVNMSVDCDYLFKLLIVGDSRVGKSNLLLRFVEDSYTEYFRLCPVDFRFHTVNVDGKTIKLQIWDTFISLRFGNSLGVLKRSFRGAHGIMMVYDVTDQDTFSNIKRWLQEIETYCIPNACKLLVGNKCDMTSQKIVDYSTAKEFADEMKINFIETSAKCAINVEQAFLTIVCDIKRNLFENEERYNTGDITHDKLILLNPRSFHGTRSTNCCRCC